MGASITTLLTRSPGYIGSLLLWAFTPIALAAPDCILVRVGGFGPGLEDYEAAVFQLAADATAATYGPCTITVKTTEYSMARVWKELNNGEKLQAGISTGYAPKFNNIVGMDFPLLGGALGLRRSIVRESMRAEFEDIQEFGQIKSYRVGQGVQWTDVETYKAMGFPVVDGFRLGHLYGMLEQGRFDHIPLSILQADAIFNRISPDYPSLVLADKTYIYYPIKTWVYLNTLDPQLLERFTLGFEQIFKSGEAEALFNRMYGVKMAQLKTSGGHVFILKNPEYTNNDNARIAQDFLHRHQLQNFAVFPNLDSSTPVAASAVKK